MSYSDLINYWKNSCPNNLPSLKNWWLERYLNPPSLKPTKRSQLRKRTWFQSLNLSPLVFPSSKYWSHDFHELNWVFLASSKNASFYSHGAKCITVNNYYSLFFGLLLIIFWIITPHVRPFCCWHVFLHSINHQLEFPPSGKGYSRYKTT